MYEGILKLWIMDIMELSRKMEGDLLESHTNYYSCKKPLISNLSPRLTRSQTMATTSSLQKPERQILPVRKPHRKVDEIESIYLNTKAKVVRKNLETIYENPIWRKGATMLLGTSKVKRSIYLDREFRITSKVKSKLRKMKIKRLGKRLKSFKMSDDEFKNKMLLIDNYINEGDTGESSASNQVCSLLEVENCDNDCTEQFESNCTTECVPANEAPNENVDIHNNSL